MIKPLRKLFGKKYKEFECVRVLYPEGGDVEYIDYKLNDGSNMFFCRHLHSSAWSHGNSPYDAFMKMLDVKSAL